ncbi:GGDEF domain-containing protein [Aeromicrobium sp. UC242_57]|uniref:GGDEF domain-containing protein n=1 Tax=Aeromicrobium sp. UC242_57 TaxID=3374624 RepID=UPI003797702C
MTWNTNQDLGALANGTALPILGAYAVWFLRWPAGRTLFYAGVVLWFVAILSRDNTALTGFALTLVVETVIATEVFWWIKTRMDRLVRTDPLTGVLNLRGVTEALDREMSRSSRRQIPLSVVSIDLDGLRALNNTLGHRAGDDLLQAVTEHWQREIRKFDVIGRTGGDEFVMVLPETSMDVAERVVERLARTSPGQWSAGVAEVKPGDSVETVLERADQRMYVDKAARHTA